MIEVLKQMVEALEWCHGGEPIGTADAIAAGRQAIAELESQNIKQVTVKDFVHMVEGREDLIGRPVYFAQWPNGNTHPPQRTWVGLTSEEIWDEWIEQSIPERNTHNFVAAFARAIESKLKELNT